MEATSSASANSLAGVLRAFSGASARQISGISRMSGSGGDAIWFMRISMDERIGGAIAALSGRLAPAPLRPRSASLRSSNTTECSLRDHRKSRPLPSVVSLVGGTGVPTEKGVAGRVQGAIVLRTVDL